MLAKLKELQQRQQQLNEQLAQSNAQQAQEPNGESPAEGQQGQQGQQGAQGQQPGTEQGSKSSDQQKAGDEDGQEESGGDQEGGDKEGGDKEGGDKEGSDQEGSDKKGAAAAAEQTALGEASADAADQLTEMPLGKSKGDANDVAGELRRASDFQENAAAAIVRSQLGQATRLGSEGSAAIAEAIHKLEELVFAGSQSGNEAESYPDGYEQLIQEYLRAISYE